MNEKYSVFLSMILISLIANDGKLIVIFRKLQCYKLFQESLAIAYVHDTSILELVQTSLWICKL